MAGNLDIGPLQSGGLDIGPLQSAGSGGNNLVGSTTATITVESISGGFVGSQQIVGSTVATITVESIPGGEIVGATLIGSTTATITVESIAGGSLTQGIAGQYTATIKMQSIPGGALIFARNAFTLFIDGVDRTELVLDNSLQITNQISQASTASFAMWDPTGLVPAPAVGQAVEVYHKSTRIFGGGVTQPVQTAWQANKGALYSGSGASGSSSAGTTGVSAATGSGATGGGGIQCSDWSFLLSRRYVGQYYASPAYLTVVVSDIVETYLTADGFTVEYPYPDPDIDIGPLLLNWVTIQDAFNTISSATGWEFTVDYFKVIRFYPPGSGTGAAPFNIADNDGNSLAESIAIEYFQAMYRNRQGVMSPTQSTALWSDIFSVAQPGPIQSSPQPPDGIRRAFFTLYALQTTPTVRVNGVPQSVIPITDVASNPPGWQWYWINPQSGGLGGPGVFQNPTNAALTALDVLEVDYASNISPIYWVQDDAQIAERAAIEDNTGVYEDVQQAPSTMTDPNAIAQYAAGLLQRYGSNGIPFQVNYSTLKDGLFAGMIQQIIISNPPITLVVGLISQVAINDVDGLFLNYSVTVLQALVQGNWTQFFAALIAGISVPQPGNFVNYTFVVAPSIVGIVTISGVPYTVTNPGVTGGTDTPGYQTVVNSVELVQSITVTLPQGYTNTGSGNMAFTLLVNGSGTVAVTFLPGAGGSLTTYVPFDSPVRIYRGDMLSIELSGGAISPVYDAQVTLTTAVAVT